MQRGRTDTAWLSALARAAWSLSIWTHPHSAPGAGKPRCHLSKLFDCSQRWAEVWGGRIETRGAWGLSSSCSTAGRSELKPASLYSGSLWLFWECSKVAWRNLPITYHCWPRLGLVSLRCDEDSMPVCRGRTNIWGPPPSQFVACCIAPDLYHRNPQLCQSRRPHPSNAPGAKPEPNWCHSISPNFSPRTGPWSNLPKIHQWLRKRRRGWVWANWPRCSSYREQPGEHSNRSRW